MSRPNDSSHLDHGSLPMGMLREQYRIELGHLLQSIHQSINQAQTQSTNQQSFALILDRSLTGLLNQMVDMEWLKQHGVSTMYYLQSQNQQSINHTQTHSFHHINHQLVEEIPPYVKHLCYFINPSISMIRLIDQQIKHSQSVNQSNGQSINHTYSMIVTPRYNILAKTEMENLKINTLFQSVSQWSVDLIPFEWDVLSLEHSESVHPLNDQSVNWLVARSIMRLQSIHGLIPVVRGKGNQSMKICSL
jgi:hypothetical protein